MKIPDPNDINDRLGDSWYFWFILTLIALGGLALLIGPSVVNLLAGLLA